MAVSGRRQALMWILLVFLLGTAFYAWGSGFSWHFSQLSLYRFFPLLGMAAWLTMFTHYLWGALRWKSPLYSQLSGYLVLLCLLLHPGIFGLAQYRAGKGFPPFNYYRYFPPSFNWAVLLGSTAVLVFLSYEVLHRLKNKPAIARHWQWISLAQAAAMFLILFHSLKLGSQLQMGWFRLLWGLCGIILVPAAYLVVSYDINDQAKSTHD